MNSKKFLPAAIAGGVAHFILGWLLYGTLLAGYMKSNEGPVTGVDRTEMLFWSVAVGSLFYGFLMSYILVRLANISSVGAGAMAGFLIGLLFTGSLDFIFYGTSNLYANLTIVFVDMATFAVMSAIVGAVVAAVAGMGKKTATA